ncbi:MAG: hypothetical protein H6722_34795 [Sandaracinus sp.]|nr:hypothetical protein [Myxococcales bacterium]MCB9617632.1 hypothetical protein [Sandaracinus sp.]
MLENETFSLVIGGLMATFGTLAIVLPGFAEWYVSTSGKGRLWARLLGSEERAVQAMRLFFGPLTLLMGLGVLYATTVP